MSETPPIFSVADFDNLELVRDVVLRRLRNDKDYQALSCSWEDRHQDVVRFSEPRLLTRFVVLAQEVMWQLIIQRVVTPGMNASNPSLPWFRITSYGEKVLAEGKLSPHDPAGYLDELRSAASTTIGKVGFAYVEEALRCFNAGCNVAAVLLLGVAAESVLLELSSRVELALRDANEQAALKKCQSAREKHRWLVKKYESLPGTVRRTQLPESLDMMLKSLGDLIRRQRNSIGHPQQTPPAITREMAFVAFRMFPEYVKAMEDFADYANSNGV